METTEGVTDNECIVETPTSSGTLCLFTAKAPETRPVSLKRRNWAVHPDVGSIVSALARRTLYTENGRTVLRRPLVSSIERDCYLAESPSLHVAPVSPHKPS